MSIILLDTETTGLKAPRLVELAYMRDGALTVIRCNPPKEIEMEARAVHHIDPEDVADLLPFQQRPDYQEIKNLLENNTIVAHNASFDIGVLKNEGITIKNFHCTKILAAKKYPDSPSHSLQYLRHWLGIRVQSLAHSAGGDVEVLALLWEKVMPR